jgi:hypothetical protein
VRTVHIDLVLLHELAQLSEPLRGVDFLHVVDGGSKGAGRVERSEIEGWGSGDYIGCC